jgi:hypothetical protein
VQYIQSLAIAASPLQVATPNHAETAASIQLARPEGQSTIITALNGFSIRFTEADVPVEEDSRVRIFSLIKRRSLLIELQPLAIAPAQHCSAQSCLSHMA